VIRVAAAPDVVRRRIDRFHLTTGVIAVMEMVHQIPGLAGRIERLARQRRDSMRRTTFSSLFGCVCVGLALGGIVSVPTLRAEEHAKKPVAAIIAAKDFWDTTGSRFVHDLDAADRARIQRLAQDRNADAATRLRATELACDLAGHSTANAAFAADKASRAVAAAMKHLESHLADPTIAKFGPELGITHLTVSERAGDGAGIWVLVESAAGDDSGGLNVRVDPANWNVTQVEQWGKVRARPALPVADTGQAVVFVA
jgi:hypothetical protein